MSPAVRPDGPRVGGVRVAGVVSCLPAVRIDNHSLGGRFGDAAVAEIIRLTGVRTRYAALPEQTASDLCEPAARRLMDRLGWDPASVDAVILVTQTPDCRIPATACLLQARLGLATTAQAFDVNLGCSGYVYGLWLAFAMVHAGLGRVLLLTADTFKDVVDPHDRATALLFGDAASATALEADPASPPAAFVLGTDGRGARNLIIQGGGFRAPVADPRMREGGDPEKLFMDGGEVFAFTLKAVPDLVQRTLRLAGRSLEEIDAVLLHQASRMMVSHLGKKIGVAPERLPINLDRYGNTGSVTLPLLMSDDLAPRLLERGGRFCLAGFGVGWSWGAVCLDLAPLGCAETLFLGEPPPGA